MNYNVSLSFHFKSARMSLGCLIKVAAEAVSSLMVAGKWPVPRSEEESISLVFTDDPAFAMAPAPGSNIVVFVSDNVDDLRTIARWNTSSLAAADYILIARDGLDHLPRQICELILRRCECRERRQMHPTPTPELPGFIGISDTSTSTFS
jgi:hypothetical protein